MIPDTKSSRGSKHTASELVRRVKWRASVDSAGLEREMLALPQHSVAVSFSTAMGQKKHSSSTASGDVNKIITTVHNISSADLDTPPPVYLPSTHTAAKKNQSHDRCAHTPNERM